MARARILFVENAAVAARDVSVLLETWGYEVETARNASEARRALSKGLPAAIVTDVEPPALDGLQLTRFLKSNPATRAVPIIGIHAVDHAAEQAALAAGCIGCVGKPLAPHRLLALLRVLAPAP
jgi:CheY-like chemotaxis protein